MSRTSAVMERRTEIIEAAIRVLSRNGITETTTRKIPAEANVHQATLGYSFGSKDDLLFAVLQEMMHRTREIVHAGTPFARGLHQPTSESPPAHWAYPDATPRFDALHYDLT